MTPFLAVFAKIGVFQHNQPNAECSGYYVCSRSEQLIADDFVEKVVLFDALALAFGLI